MRVTNPLFVTMQPFMEMVESVCWNAENDSVG